MRARICGICRFFGAMEGSLYCRPCWNGLKDDLRRVVEPAEGTSEGPIGRTVAAALILALFCFLLTMFAGAAEPSCACWSNGTVKESSREGYHECLATCRSIAL